LHNGVLLTKKFGWSIRPEGTVGWTMMSVSAEFPFGGFFYVQIVCSAPNRDSDYPGVLFCCLLVPMMRELVSFNDEGSRGSASRMQPMCEINFDAVTKTSGGEKET
jgi:hypothetical protein